MSAMPGDAAGVLQGRPDPFDAPVVLLSSGPAINLTGLAYLERFSLLAQVVVPHPVLDDVARSRPELGRQVRQARHVFCSEPAAESMARARAAGLDTEGDAAVVALALESLGVPVLDDPQSQRHAARLALPVASTLGLLDQLHGVGLAARPLRQDLMFLELSGYPFSARLRAAMSQGTRELRRALALEALSIGWEPPAAAPKPSAPAELEELER